MIHIDRKVARACLRLAGRSYDAELQYSPAEKQLQRIDGSRTVMQYSPLALDAREVQLALERLIDKGYLLVRARYWGGYSFGISPALRHWFAFLVDRFSKKFVVGFLSGVLTGVLVNLISGYAQELLAKVFQ